MQVTIEELQETGIGAEEAQRLHPRIVEIMNVADEGERWMRMTREVLSPAHPFPLHRRLHERAFAKHPPEAGPAPAWFPEHPEETNLWRFMQELGMEDYPEFHRWSTANRAEFWKRTIERLGIRFETPFDRVLDLSHGAEYPEWLCNARYNIVASCFQADPEGVAIVHQREGGEIHRESYRQLEALTRRVARGVLDLGFQPGDAIAIDMPMNAASVAIYLGIVAAGCIVVSIADSFAPEEIAVRLRISKAAGIFTQDVIRRGGRTIPLFERVVQAQAPRAIVLASEGGKPTCTLREGDLTWEAFLPDEGLERPIPRNPHDHTNILFSSGTTGEPKAIPWTQTTPIKAAADGFFHHDIQPGDVVAWPTNLGWMMGPWLIYASLINRATIALFDGAPTGRPFGTFVQDAGVTMLGLVPSLVRQWRESGCMAGLDWGRIKAFSSTGECSNPEEMLYLMSLAGYRPILEYCGGTEIGGGYITGTLLQPAAPGMCTTPALGIDFVILDESGKEADFGEVFLLPPSIGLSTELLNRDHHEVYYADTPRHPDPAVSLPLRRHGDLIERLPGGFFRIHGRVDDTMNLGGIKVSSAEIEAVLNVLPEVHETAAIAVPPPGGGPSRLVVYAVAAAETSPETLRGVMQRAIHTHLNPLFKIHEVVVVDALPRTASNKVMRRVLRQRYLHEG